MATITRELSKEELENMVKQVTKPDTFYTPLDIYELLSAYQVCITSPAELAELLDSLAAQGKIKIGFFVANHTNSMSAVTPKFMVIRFR